MLTKVLIDGIDVTSKCVNWENEKTYGDLLSEITNNFVVGVNSLVTINNGLEIKIYRGWTLPTEELLFSGYIEKFEPEAGLITLTSLDKLWDAVRDEITVVYDSETSVTAGKLSAIFQDIINRYCSEVSAANTNTSTSSGKLIDSTASFTTAGIVAGDNVWNQDDNTWTTVVSVDSATQITLNDNIFTSNPVNYIVKPVSAMYADNISVQDSGTVTTIGKFLCNHADPFERLKKLASILEWQFYYRSDTNKVYFEPKGYVSNPNVLTVGDNVIQVPKWQYDITEMINDVTIVGAYQEVETTKSGQIGVTSGFTTTGISLDYEPISVKVYGDASNPPTTLKVGGTPDSTLVFDYYVDKTQKKIFPRSGTTFAANDYYEIRYSLAAPMPVNLYNQSSIDTYGRFKKTVTYKDLRSVADAEVRGQNYLDKYSIPFIYTTLKVRNNSSLGLAVGQNINVIDNLSTPAVNKILTINKIRVRFPADYDEIDVGDRYWRLADFNATVMEKFKRIEEEEYANQDILNSIISADNRIVSPIKAKNRYVISYTQNNTAPDCFIFDNPNHGRLGTDNLSVSGIGDNVLYHVWQGNDKYTEKFYDEDFKDVSTTCYWDTSSRKLRMNTTTSFGVDVFMGKSSYIFYNTSITITRVLPTWTETKFGGDVIEVYVTADGVNWEQVENGVEHVLTNTGNFLQWMVIFIGQGGPNTYIEDLTITPVVV